MSYCFLTFTESGRRMLALILRLFTFVLVCSTAEDLKEVTAQPGDNVVLQCRGSSHGAVDLLEWSRTDLKSEYVFYYRDGLVYDDSQHKAFHGRVELKDAQMKDGDASVVLKNVTIRDTGTYECRVIQGNTRSVRTGSSEVSSSVLLTVDKGGAGHSPGLTAGLVVSALILLAAGVGVIYKVQSSCRS
ncbi:hyaluronan and proteoglycan link protein 4-like [Betta splendens]|uniref:Hyaluronan and proteoglycan link protein 4-like n=1 Tax=Betta splendens TaxID=158456 RepID=A0A6P7LVN7_BETSP|nr:hyaluronan and proteoglycan link protein 4-like [Betta splendens]